MYKNCSEIPIFNFFELIKSSNLELLLEKGEKIKDYDKNELTIIMFDILTEYNSLTENRKLMQEYTNKIDIEYMEARYNITKQLISLYNEYRDVEILSTLKDFKWKIDLSKPIKPQIDRIIKVLVGIKNKLNIKKINFVKKFNKEYKKTNPNFDLELAIVNLEVGIPLSYKIDIYSDSIKKYVYWNKALENKNKIVKEDGKVKSKR